MLASALVDDDPPSVGSIVQQHTGDCYGGVSRTLNGDQSSSEREYLMSRLVDKWKSHPWTPADAVHAWLESEIVTRSLGWYRACDEQPGSSI